MASEKCRYGAIFDFNETDYGRRLGELARNCRRYIAELVFSDKICVCAFYGLLDGVMGIALGEYRLELNGKKASAIAEREIDN